MSDAFGPGSVSLGIYVDPAPPDAILSRMLDQARLADEVGVDGVTVSEHHAGFPTYVPNPLQVAGWMLERTPRVWAGPNPMLLPLRPVALVAEELAWLGALHPGRVGAGVAPGYVAGDFDLYGLDFDLRSRMFSDALPTLSAAVSGRPGTALGDDPAVAGCASRPIPLVAAAGSAFAARRAAAAGVGLLTDSLAAADRLRDLFAAYAEAGGTGARCVTRRVWIGDAPTDLVEAQAARYRRAAPAGSWLTTSGGAIRLESGPADELGDRIASLLRDVGGTHLALKVHVLGVTHEQSMDQIAALAEVLPRARAGMGVST